MIIHLIFTGCLVGLTVLNYYAGRRNVLYPAFLFSLVWLVVFCLYRLPLIEADDLGSYTLAVVVAGTAAFSAGAAIATRRTHSRPIAVRRCQNVITKKVIFFCCLALLPAFVSELGRLSVGGGLDGFMMSARAAIVNAIANEQTPFSSLLFSAIYVAGPMFSTFTAFIFLIEAREWRRDRPWVWGSILLALVFAVLTTGRTFFVQLVIGLVGIFLLKSKRFSAKDAWKFVRWPLLGALALFTILVPINKDISGVEGGTTQVVARYVLGYAVIPLAGFDYVLNHPSEYEYDPNHTFKQVLPSLARVLGLRYAPPPALDEFVWVPAPTNVYTVFKFYYVDFGLAGMLITMVIIGACHTWLFRKALAGEHFYVFLFAFSLYPLLMVIFDDLYSQMLNNMVALVFAALYFLVFRTIPLRAWVAHSQPGPVKSEPREKPGSGVATGTRTDTSLSL